MYSEEEIEWMCKVHKKSGLGDVSSHLPPAIHPGHCKDKPKTGNDAWIRLAFTDLRAFACSVEAWSSLVSRGMCWPAPMRTSLLLNLWVGCMPTCANVACK